MAESDSLKRLVVLYSLLASSDGKNLQKYVYKSLGFNSLNDAKNQFKKDISERLRHTTDDGYKSAIKKLNKNFIAKIVKFANSDTDLDGKDFFENFDEIAQRPNPTTK
jgi:hypothetical protein